MQVVTNLYSWAKETYVLYQCGTVPPSLAGLNLTSAKLLQVRWALPVRRTRTPPTHPSLAEPRCPGLKPAARLLGCRPAYPRAAALPASLFCRHTRQLAVQPHLI